MHAEVCPNFWLVVYIVQRQLQEGNCLNVANMLCIALTLVFSYSYWDFNHDFFFLYEKNLNNMSSSSSFVLVFSPGPPWLCQPAHQSRLPVITTKARQSVSERSPWAFGLLAVNKTFECRRSFFELLYTIFQSHIFLFLNCNCNVFLSYLRTVNKCTTNW